MKRPLRLFFDECCSVRLGEKILQVHQASHGDLVVEHLPSYLKGTEDIVWLKRLKESGDWTVITADRGKRTAGAKLPAICREIGLTHILISGHVLSAGYSAQEKALLEVWDHLSLTPLLPSGTTLMLSVDKISGGTKGYLHVKGVRFAPWCAKNNVSLS